MEEKTPILDHHTGSGIGSTYIEITPMSPFFYICVNFYIPPGYIPIIVLYSKLDSDDLSIYWIYLYMAIYLYISFSHKKKII